MPRLGRSLSSAVAGFVAARAMNHVPPPAAPGWKRTNFRGRSVTLTTGRSAAAGLLAGLSASPAALVPVAAAAAAGAYDDLVASRTEAPVDKGLRGHFGALRAGRATGGAVKIIVICGGSLVGALLSDGRGVRSVVTRAALIASAANLVNLFDLRPGRAAKVSLALAVTGWGSSNPLTAAASGAVTGAVLATIGQDLDERGMLGDLGANALGAAVGIRLASAHGRTPTVALGVILALTLASERVSFSKVIESTPALTWLDRLGRR